MSKTSFVPAGAGAEPALGESLLEVRGLAVSFGRGAGGVHAVHDATFDVRPGEVVGLVGESGSGKSVSALALLGLLPRTATVSGAALYRGKDLLRLDRRQQRDVRGGEIAMVFQDPLSSLNPVLTVERQLVEAIAMHTPLRGSAARRRAIELLESVGIPGPEERVRQYPHQFSGGMRQRVMIASALACEATLLIADEPTTALDVTVQAQILDLLRKLSGDLGLAVLLITHDLGVVAGTADRVYVMYAGRIVEAAPVDDALSAPRHPYTAGLLQAVPRLDRPRAERLAAIPGAPPDPSQDLTGCSFRPRCRHSFQRCVERPPLLDIAAEHKSACWLGPTETSLLP